MRFIGESLRCEAIVRADGDPIHVINLLRCSLTWKLNLLYLVKNFDSPAHFSHMICCVGFEQKSHEIFSLSARWPAFASPSFSPLLMSRHNYLCSPSTSPGRVFLSAVFIYLIMMHICLDKEKIVKSEKESKRMTWCFSRDNSCGKSSANKNLHLFFGVEKKRATVHKCRRKKYMSLGAGKFSNPQRDFMLSRCVNTKLDFLQIYTDGLFM